MHQEEVGEQIKYEQLREHSSQTLMNMGLAWKEGPKYEIKYQRLFPSRVVGQL
jgi:hypothetical protein